MFMSKETDQIFSAIVAASAEMPAPVKDSQVSYKNINFRYASLGALLDCGRRHLNKHDLASIGMGSEHEGKCYWNQMLIHKSGQFVAGVLPMDMDPQELGKHITYYRRYGISGLINVASEDDTDGPRSTPPAASGRAATSAKSKPDTPAPESEKAKPEVDLLGTAATGTLPGRDADGGGSTPWFPEMKTRDGQYRAGEMQGALEAKGITEERFLRWLACRDSAQHNFRDREEHTFNKGSVTYMAQASMINVIARPDMVERICLWTANNEVGSISEDQRNEMDAMLKGNKGLTKEAKVYAKKHFNKIKSADLSRMQAGQLIGWMKAEIGEDVE